MDRDKIEEQHLRDSRIFGQVVGVWPKQKKFMKYFTRIVTSVIVMSSNAAQVAQVIVFFSLDVLTDQLPFLVLGVGILLKQYNYILNEAKLTELLNGIVTDRLMGRSEGELKILETYYKRTTFLSSIYKATMVCCMLTFVLLPTIPPILDIVAPLNASRPLVLVYPSYYFVDDQEYYFPILGHMIISAIILVFVFIACDLNLVHIVQHACALFAISGYRFKHATDDTDFYEQKSEHTTVDESYAKVSHSIDAHKRAIEYVQMVDACHVHYLFLLLGLVIAVLSVTFVKLVTMEVCSAYFTYCVFLIAQLIHLLFLSIMGQFVIDSNEEIFQTICEARWYNGSPKTQSLYVLVLRKCLNAPKLTGGGLISLNLDGFLKIIKASFSYYTVLKSS